MLTYISFKFKIFTWKNILKNNIKLLLRYHVII
jgi:hypothetical protein